MMQLAPASLSPIAGLDSDEVLSAAKSSPLMQRESILPLIRLLSTGEKNEEALSTSERTHLRLK